MQLFAFPFRAMACDNTIAVYAADHETAAVAARSAQEEVLRIEHKYSRYRDDSLVAQLHRAAGGAAIEIDPETAALLDYADTLHAQSGGLFDLTSGVLRRAWDFRSGQPPDAAAIDAVLPLVGWKKVERTAHGVRLPVAGMELDFGGIGKEYAADRAAEHLVRCGMRHGFVNLGGDVVVTGPHAGGQAWEVGIQHPRRTNALAARLTLASGALASSGDYERFFEFGGRRYCHFLDPRSGQSVEGLQCVSVLAPSCLVAGSISTLAMLMGDPGGLEILEQFGAPYFAIDHAGRIHRRN